MSLRWHWAMPMTKLHSSMIACWPLTQATLRWSFCCCFNIVSRPSNFQLNNVTFLGLNLTIIKRRDKLCQVFIQDGSYNRRSNIFVGALAFFNESTFQGFSKPTRHAAIAASKARYYIWVVKSRLMKLHLRCVVPDESFDSKHALRTLLSFRLGPNGIRINVFGAGC